MCAHSIAAVNVQELDISVVCVWRMCTDSPWYILNMNVQELNISVVCGWRMCADSTLCILNVNVQELDISVVRGWRMRTDTPRCFLNQKQRWRRGRTPGQQGIILFLLFKKKIQNVAIYVLYSRRHIICPRLHMPFVHMTFVHMTFV